MHERSLARAIVAQVEELGREYTSAGRPARVRSACIHVGVLAGVEILQLQLALEAWTRTTGVAYACQAAPLTLRCRKCGGVSQRGEVCFVCSCCGGRDVEVLAGDAVILESVDLAIVDSDDAMLAQDRFATLSP